MTDRSDAMALDELAAELCPCTHSGDHVRSDDGICEACGIKWYSGELAVYCPDCGPVSHQPIPEDEAHCGCVQKDNKGRGVNYDGNGDEASCDCECHA